MIVSALGQPRKYAQICKRSYLRFLDKARKPYMKDHHGCPVQATVNVLSGKWKVQILWHLSFGDLRFAQLRRKLRTVSEKVLTDQLRQLERDEVIFRRIAPTNPPAVTYSLNPEGRKLVPLMESLCNWGSTHFRMKPSLPQKMKSEAPMG